VILGEEKRMEPDEKEEQRRARKEDKKEKTLQLISAYKC